MTEQKIDLDTTVAICAREVHGRFRQFVDQADLVQEGYVWVFDHAARVDEYTTDEDVKRGRYRLRRDIMMAMERYARTERATRTGFSVRDEVFYDLSDKQLAAMLGMLTIGVVRGIEYNDEIRSVGLMSEQTDGKDTEVGLIDLVSAIEALPTDERELVWWHYVEGAPMQTIADQIGLDRSTVSRRLRRCREKISRHLGGLNPWRDYAPDENRPGVHSTRSGTNQLVQ